MVSTKQSTWDNLSIYQHQGIHFCLYHHLQNDLPGTTDPQLHASPRNSLWASCLMASKYICIEQTFLKCPITDTLPSLFLTISKYR